MDPPPIDHSCMQDHYTTEVSHIGECIYILMADGPPCQLSIDALNTTTPNLAGLTDIAQCTYMHGRWMPLN